MKTLFTLLLVFIAVPAFAHVTVKPAQTGVASYQTFTVGVPVEKDIPTTQVRLVIPAGVDSVMPYVKPGWKIVSDGKEIVWNGGSIPVGQRDDFFFSAKAPATEGVVTWKAYQTYSDGSVVAWDGGTNPSSNTEIINDLATDHHGMPKKPFPLATVALVISLVALGLSLRKR